MAKGLSEKAVAFLKKAPQKTLVSFYTGRFKVPQ
jgi:hypothetical protein